MPFDFGGGGEYKTKYGGVETPSVRYTAFRFGFLRYGREAARRLFRLRQASPGSRRTPHSAVKT